MSERGAPLPTDISTPNITPQLDGLRLDWANEHLACDVTAIYPHHDGCVACELHITTSAEGFNPHLLRHHVSDLANASSRDRLATLLSRAYNHVQWADLVEDICEYTLMHLRRPPALISAFDFVEAKQPEFLLSPFILQGENNMLFGPGGGGKSALALLWLILMERPTTEQFFGWLLTNQPRIWLYLDWERSFNTQAWRMRGTLNGLRLPAACPDTPLHYQRLHRPLTEEVKNVQALINQCHAEGVIIDSAGVASGGDMNKTEPAMQFFGALGGLRTPGGGTMTSLILTHVAKNQETNRKSPYGNIYWRNECSSVWEIIPVEDREHNLTRMTLHCDKHNDYAWVQDIGLEVQYSFEGTKYELCEPPSQNLPGEGHEDRILEALHYPMSPAEIATKSGLVKNIVSSMLSRMAKDGEVEHVGRGLWARVGGRGEGIE